MVPQAALRPGPDRGLRPVDLSRDLGQIAALMEVVFGGTMDAAALASMREMRALSHTGPWLWLMSRLDSFAEGFAPGFVWIEEGRIVGNVSIRRLDSSTAIWLIGNVGVHPDYRRRGIARELMLAAIDLTESVRGRWAALQVESNNAPAIALYRQLGFVRVGAAYQWVRPAGLPRPSFREGQQQIRLRRPDEWREDLDLARSVWPVGIQEIEPIQAAGFHNGFFDSLANLLAGRRREFWTVDHAGRLAASLHIVMRLGAEEDLMSLAVATDLHGQVEMDLLTHGLRRLSGRNRPIRTEHPAGDEAAESTFKALGFEWARGLDTMRRPLGRRRLEF